MSLPADVDRATLARAGLRAILGAQVGIAPQHLSFLKEPKGKPYLDPSSHPALSFSISHSGDWILIGVASGHRVGIDIERRRVLRNPERVIDRYFTASEAAAIRQMPERQRLDAFFDCWTRKEAYVKAIGGGISSGLRSFAVSVGLDQPPAVLEVDGSEHAAADWTIWAGIPGPDYVAAAAVDSPAITVDARYWLGTRGIVPWSDVADSGLS